MKGHEFEAMLRSGHQPVVTFSKGVDEQEGYLEPNMRGRLTAVRVEDDDLLVFTVDLQEFESFNAPYESANYYDKSGSPCLTAKQAGQYTLQESLWASQSGDVPMIVEVSDRLQLFQLFQKASTDKNYVQWLEDGMLALQGIQPASC